MPKKLLNELNLTNPDLATEVRRDPVGYLVHIEFGRGKQIKEGIIVDVVNIDTDSDYTLKNITQIVSLVPVVDTKTVTLYREIAQYYGTTLAELLPLIIPRRSVQAEKELLKLTNCAPILNPVQLPFLHSVNPKMIEERQINKQIVPDKCSLRVVPKLNNWAKTISKLAMNDLFHNRSVLILLPTDYLLEIFEKILLNDFSANFPEGDVSKHILKLSANMTGKARYSNFLKCQYNQGTKVVFGNLSAAFAPFTPDSIYLFGDNDPNFKEMRSPYHNAREIALIRNSKQLGFISYVPSFSVERLAKLGFLDEVKPESGDLRKICRNITSIQTSFSETIPPLGFNAIRNTLKENKPVLILYPKSGNVRLMTCNNCRSVAECKICESALITNAKRLVICPHCEAHYPHYVCPKCNGTALRYEQIGNDELAHQLGRAFEDVPIYSSSLSSDNGILRTIENKAAICIATPGSEPIPDKGYGAVIITDAGYWNAILSLEGKHDTLARWFYVTSLLETKTDPQTPSVLLVGNTESKYYNAMQMLDPDRIILQDLKDKKLTKSPPFWRYLCISGHPDILAPMINYVQSDPEYSEFEIMGPYPLNETAYYNLWNNSMSSTQFICYLIRTAVKGDNTVKIANLSHKLKVKGNVGFTTPNGKKVRIGTRTPCKFLLDPRELI